MMHPATPRLLVSFPCVLRIHSAIERIHRPGGDWARGGWRGWRRGRRRGGRRGGRRRSNYDGQSCRRYRCGTPSSCLLATRVPLVLAPGNFPSRKAIIAIQSVRLGKPPQQQREQTQQGEQAASDNESEVS